MKKFHVRDVVLVLLVMWVTVSAGTSSGNKQIVSAEALAVPNGGGEVQGNPFSQLTSGSISTSASVYMGELNIFLRYHSWTHSMNKKADDGYAQFIYFMNPQTSTFDSRYGNTNPTNTNSNYTMVDVNGDGLVDMLYRYGPAAITGSTSGYELYLMALWLNTGSNGYSLVYKCVVDPYEDYSGDPAIGWYGDCAASE